MCDIIRQQDIIFMEKKMNKELVLKEMDRIIFEEKTDISFRTIATNLNIAPSSISYQFSNQDNLYKEYLKFKLKQIITPTSIQSFENLMIAFGNFVYELFYNISKDVTFNMFDALLGSVVMSNFSVIDSLFAQDYEAADREKTIAIISNIIIAMSFPKSYSQLLNYDLTEQASRDQLIKNIVKREVNN